MKCTLLGFCIFLYLFHFSILTIKCFFKCLFIFERESANRVGPEREGERENPQKALHCQLRAWCQTQTHEPWDHDLSQNQELATYLPKWATQVPPYFFFGACSNRIVLWWWVISFCLKIIDKNIKYCIATRIWFLIIRLAMMIWNTILLDKKLAKCLPTGVCIAAGLWRQPCIAPPRTLHSLICYSFICRGIRYQIVVLCISSALYPSLSLYFMTIVTNACFPNIP